MKQKPTIKFYDAYNFQAGKDYYRITFHKKNCVKIVFGILLDKILTVENADLIKELVWEAVGNFIEANGKKFHVSFNHKFSVERRLEDGLYMEVFNECTNATKAIMKQAKEKHQNFLKKQKKYDTILAHKTYIAAENEKRALKEEEDKEAFEKRKKAFYEKTKLDLKQIQVFGKCAVDKSVFKNKVVHHFPKPNLRNIGNTNNVWIGFQVPEKYLK